MLTTLTRISQFPTVNKRLAKKLDYLGLKTAGDLLFYFPFRYEDFSKTVLIKDIAPGEKITVRGRLELIANKRSSYQRRMLTEALVADESGRLKVVWFNQPFLTKIFTDGDRISLAGKMEIGRFGLQMTNPTIEKEKEDSLHTGRIVPIYSVTSGVTQKHIRFLIKFALAAASELKEWLPKEIINSNNFPCLARALEEIHFPLDEAFSQKARERFQFEELFLIQLKTETERCEILTTLAPRILFKEEETKKFVNRLPFKLTNDQRQTAWEILKDLAGNNPMNRLLDGDVGSGKTIVAAVAVFNAVLNNYQAALMAPTEILATQHFYNLSTVFKDRGVVLGLLTGSMSKIFDNEIKEIKRAELLEKLKKGEINFIIGTHALIEDKVKFKRLGIAIVDEQHRFGVEQRKKIRLKANLKNKLPHFLSMTATPIPRSYALALYGDLDLSLIKEMPPGRQKIITKPVDEINRPKTYQFIKEQIASGRQAFVICPLIETKETSGDRLPIGRDAERKTVLTEHKKLSQEIFPDLKINFLHGKMKAKEKEKIMADFLTRKFDILVSTSVVEVGIDIPNATVMMIEGAESFGLSQLHQFRGRVGRGLHQSYCFLFSNAQSESTKKRLEYFTANLDGFVLAEKDLELRGPGEVFGTRQHGFPELKIANLQNLDLIKKSREAARSILEKDPLLALHPEFKERMLKKEKLLHLE